MAKYVIETFSQDEYTFRMYHNTKKKSWQQIKRETGCYGIINTAYFNMITFAVDSNTMIAKKWLFGPTYHEYGLCVDADGKLTVGTEKEAAYDFTVGLPPCYINGQKYSTKEHGRNGASFVGVAKNGDVTCLIADKSNGMTTAECCAALLKAGCSDIFRFDGSWSSQGSLGPGKDLDPAQERKVAVYLLIFKKTSDKSEDTSNDVADNIKTVQSTLNTRYSSGLVVDGSWGPASKKAMIKAVQTEINKLYGGNLVVDGSWGPASKRACPDIKSVTKNNLAWLVQACLVVKGYDLALDGSYGPACAAAIKDFKKNNNLNADGVCDKNAFTKLLA